MTEDKEKYVDESWKDSVEKEKEILKDAGHTGESKLHVDKSFSDTKEQPAKHEPEEHVHGENCNHSHEAPGVQGTGEQPSEGEMVFLNYVTSLGYQALIFMGEVENPVTNSIEKHMEQAKFLIDTLAMLREKTKGNLSERESQLLESSIYELQTKFVEASQKDPSSAKEGQDSS